MENNLIKLTIKNDIEGVKKLIADGADINIQSNEGNTALIIASYRGYTEIVKILFEWPVTYVHDVRICNKVGKDDNFECEYFETSILKASGCPL